MNVNQYLVEIDKKHRKTLLLLLGLTVLAFLLRIWGLDFGLPNDSRPDEEPLIQVALYNYATPLMTKGIVLSSPGSFYHPSVWSALLSWVYFAYYFVAGVSSWPQFLSQYHMDPTSFFLLARYVSAVLGACCVPAAFLLGVAYKDNQDKTTAWLLAGFTTISYMMVRNSHFGVMDMLLTLLTILSLWRILLYFKNKTFKNAVWMAILVGLAMSTKYAGVMLLVPMTLALYLKSDREIHTTSDDEKPLLAEASLDPRIPYVLVLLTFLVLNPWLLFNFDQFIQDVVKGAQQLKSFLPMGEFGATYYPRFILGQSLGWGFTGVFLLGVWLGFQRWLLSDTESLMKKSPFWIHTDGILLITLLTWFVLMAVQTTVMTRYALPLMPLILLYGVLGLQGLSVWVYQKLKRFEQSKIDLHEQTILLCLAVLVALPMAITTLHFNVLMSTTDTRSIARDWLMHHVPSGSPVAIGVRVGGLRLPATYGQLVMDAAWNNLKPMPLDPSEIETLEVNEQTRLITSYLDIQKIRDWGIRYVLIFRAQPLFSNPPWELLHYQQYTKLVQYISPYKNGVNGVSLHAMDDVYEPLDAFFLPFSRFEKFQRPGPEIFIFDITQSPQS